MSEKAAGQETRSPEGCDENGPAAALRVRDALFAQTPLQDKQPKRTARFTFAINSIELRSGKSEIHKMKTRCFDHIDLRVKDMEVARKFYGKFLPELGFVHESPGNDFHTFYAGGSDRPLEFFAFDQDKNHRPNGTRIAFWADTREEVDRIAKLVRDAGGKNLEGPEICMDYSPGYYAFFFEDPDGNKLEICCREKPVFAG